MRTSATPGTLGVQPIKRFLQEAGIRHREVAATIGWQYSGQLSKILNGQRRTTYEVAARIAAVVGRRVDECFSPEAHAPPRRRFQPDQSEFGVQPIKEFLADAGLTYKQVAAAIGATGAQVMRTVNGQQRSSRALAGAIASLVDKPVADCFTQETLLPRARRRRLVSGGPLGVQPVRDVLADLRINDPAAARVLGCSTTYVGWIVNGNKRPSLVHAARLARLAGQSIEACFTLDEVEAHPDGIASAPYGPQPLGTLLDEASITPVEAAHTLKLSVSFIEMVLSGGSRLSLEHAAALARLAGRPVEDCFTDSLLGLDEEIVEVAEGTVERMLRRQWNPATPGPLGVQPIKGILAKLHITHEDAAWAIGYTQQHVTHIVNGQSPLSIVVAARLARLVGRPIGECFRLGDHVRKVRREKPGPYGPQPLRGLLAAVGTSASQAAEAVRVGQVFIRRVLAGQVRPSLEQAVLLARLVERPIEDCFSAEMLGVDKETVLELHGAAEARTQLA